MTERQLDVLKENYSFLNGIMAHSNIPKGNQLLAKLGVSWPTFKKKSNQLIQAKIVIEKGKLYKVNPDILDTAFFVGIYFDGVNIECIALNLAQETVELKDILSEQSYADFTAIIQNQKLSILSKITFLSNLLLQEEKVLNVGISTQGTTTINNNGETVINNPYLTLSSSSFPKKCVIFETVRAQYYMLKSEYLTDNMWYLYNSDEFMYLLGNSTIDSERGLIWLNEFEKKAIKSLEKPTGDIISICEAKEIVLHKIKPFIQFVCPDILIIGGALATKEIANLVYSDVKALNINTVKFDNSNFAKSIACLSMSEFFKK